MLNWLHACFGVGAASGPLIMTAVLESGSSWRRGYAIVGLAQLALAACFVVTFRSWPRSDGGGTAEHTKSETTVSTLRVPGAWLGIAAFFVYSGVEASIGAWTYTLLTEGRRMAPVEAGLIVSLYLGKPDRAAGCWPRSRAASSASRRWCASPSGASRPA